MSERILIDCLGEFCPMPVIKLRKAADAAAPGTDSCSSVRRNSGARIRSGRLRIGGILQHAVRS